MIRFGWRTLLIWWHAIRTECPVMGWKKGVWGIHDVIAQTHECHYLGLADLSHKLLKDNKCSLWVKILLIQTYCGIIHYLESCWETESLPLPLWYDEPYNMSIAMLWHIVAVQSLYRWAWCSKWNESCMQNSRSPSFVWKWFVGDA